jgi:regulation of enolase protein 1 (concanavalin A-like superfamily)
MKSISWLLLCALVASADDKRLVEINEGFDGALPTAWQWIREDANEWRIQDGKLVVRSQPGRIWGGNDGKNVLLVAPVQGGSVDARISVAHQPKELYEQAGLLWYVDDDNFVKLISEHIEGKMYVVVAREERGKGKVIGKIEVPTSDLQLRLKVEGQTVSGQWRVKDQDDWRNAGTCSFEVDGQRRFGIFTQNGPADVTRWVSFDEFVVSRAHPAP